MANESQELHNTNHQQGAETNATPMAVPSVPSLSLQTRGPEVGDTTATPCPSCASRAATPEAAAPGGSGGSGASGEPVAALRAANLQRERSGGLRYRKNLLRLTDAEWDDLHRAFKGLRDLPEADSRNYLRQADIHRDYCDHNRESFAPWHRAYLYQFELLLQEQVPGVMLPYWDWTVTREIPAPFAAPEWSGGPNPLLNDTRQPGADFLLPTSDTVEQVKRLATFARFGGSARSGASPGQPGALELQAHNGVHVWVGGDMGVVNLAGRDPLFWVHHANVDRIWAKWQVLHPGVEPVELDLVLDPWTVTTRQMLSTSALGYEYAEDATLFLFDNQRSLGSFRSASAQLPSALLQNGFAAAELQLHNVRYPRESFVLHVLLNSEDDATRALSPQNPHYAGMVPFFGHGECVGGEGHCDVPAQPRSRFDLRRPHKMTPFEMALDVTPAIKKLSPEELRVTFVLTDSRGAVLSGDELQMDALSVVVK